MQGLSPCREHKGEWGDRRKGEENHEVRGRFLSRNTVSALVNPSDQSKSVPELMGEFRDAF